MQRSGPPMPTGSGLRIGIAAGDVTWEDDDCFGLPVVVAARLEAAGGGRPDPRRPGGPLAGRRPLRSRLRTPRRPAARRAPRTGRCLPRAVVRPDRSRSGCRSRRRWPCPRSSASSGARRSGARSTGCGRPPRRANPGWSCSAARPGRARPGWPRSSPGPGSGRGRRCCSARCDAQLVVPYQPWIQALEQLLRVVRPDELAAETTADLGALAALLPSLDRGAGPRTTERPIDADMERLRLFNAVEAVLAEAAVRWPVVLVLDDLHWAGAQTLALLGRIARSGWARPDARDRHVPRHRRRGDRTPRRHAGRPAPDPDRSPGCASAAWTPTGWPDSMADATGRALDADLARIAAQRGRAQPGQRLLRR